MHNNDSSNNRYDASHLEEKRSSPRATNGNTSMDSYESSAINLANKMKMCCKIGEVRRKGSTGTRTQQCNAHNFTPTYSLKLLLNLGMLAIPGCRLRVGMNARLGYHISDIGHIEDLRDAYKVTLSVTSRRRVHGEMVQRRLTPSRAWKRPPGVPRQMFVSVRRP